MVKNCHFGSKCVYDGQLASLKCRSYEKMMKFLGNLTKQPKLADHQKKHDKNTITNQLPGLIPQHECQPDQTKLLLPTDNSLNEQTCTMLS